MTDEPLTTNGEVAVATPPVVTPGELAVGSGGILAVPLTAIVVCQKNSESYSTRSWTSTDSYSSHPCFLSSSASASDRIVARRRSTRHGAGRRNVPVKRGKKQQRAKAKWQRNDVRFSERTGWWTRYSGKRWVRKCAVTNCLRAPRKKFLQGGRKSRFCVDHDELQGTYVDPREYAHILTGAPTLREGLRMLYEVTRGPAEAAEAAEAEAAEALAVASAAAAEKARQAAAAAVASAAASAAAAAAASAAAAAAESSSSASPEPPRKANRNRSSITGAAYVAPAAPPPPPQQPPAVATAVPSPYHFPGLAQMGTANAQQSAYAAMMANATAQLQQQRQQLYQAMQNNASAMPGMMGMVMPHHVTNMSMFGNGASFPPLLSPMGGLAGVSLGQATVQANHTHPPPIALPTQTYMGRKRAAGMDAQPVAKRQRVGDAATAATSPLPVIHGGSMATVANPFNPGGRQSGT